MASTIKVDKIAQASGTPEFTIPTADGTAKSALITDGSGVLSFATGTPSSSNFLRGDGTWQAVTTTALTGSTNTWIPTITGANALTGTANFTYDGNTLDVKNSGTASSINLYCESSNAHYVKIKSGPHASATSYTLTLPNAPPSANGEVLSATTAGVSSWVASGIGADSAMITKSSDQAISNNTIQTITFDVEAFDTSAGGNMVNLANNRIDIKTAGTYLIGGVIYYTGAPAGESRYIYIHWYDDSASADKVAYRWTWHQTSASPSTEVLSCGMIQLAVDDYIYLKGFQNANNAGVGGDASGLETRLWVTRIE